MAEYITKEQAKLAIKKRLGTMDLFESRFNADIDAIPAADVVEVVRCGKCKHFRPYEGEEHKGDCAELVGLESCVYEDDFCSYGERKENTNV